MKKFILTICILCSSLSCVKADVLNNEFTNSAMTSNYSVLIPKKIDLNTNSNFITISAKGNLRKKEFLKVTFDDVDMKRENDTTYSKMFKLNSTTMDFKDTELSNTYTSKNNTYANLDETKAGTYTGSLNFKITLEREQPKYTYDVGEVTNTVKAMLYTDGQLLIEGNGIINSTNLRKVVNTDIKILELYISGSNNHVKAPSDCGGLFTCFTDVKIIDISNLDLSITESMEATFDELSNLETINMPIGNAPLLFNFHRTFQNCSSLKKIDMSSIKLSRTSYGKVLILTFAGCSNLEEANLSNFDGFDLDMGIHGLYGVFAYCNKLKTLVWEHADEVLK